MTGVGSGGGLPITDTAPAPIAGGAILLMLAGAAVVALMRRRTPARQ